MRPFPTFPHTQNKAQKTFSIYINAENLCFFNVFAASFRFNRSQSSRRFLIARLQINIVEVSLKICCFFDLFVVLESLFCSFSPANFSNRCRFMCVNSTSLGSRSRNLFSRSTLSILQRFFLVSSAQFHAFSKGFLMNFEGLRDFHLNSSLQFRLLGLMIAKTYWNLIKLHPFEDANDTPTSWNLSKGFHSWIQKSCENKINV